MRILYHSAPPLAKTGYGVCTKHLAPRFNTEHDVSIHSVGGFDGMGFDWEGMHIYPSGAGKFGEHSIPYWYDKTDADVVFSHHDHWSMADTFSTLQQNGVPTILYTVLDNDIPGARPPEPVVQACENATRTVVMSEWALERVKNSRIPDDRVAQIPHGVNTTKYAPVTPKISEAELKRDLGVPEDCYLFGMVAANYGPRKVIPNHIEAYKRLLDEGADDAYFYVHAHPTMTDGYDLYQIRDALGIDQERLMFPDPNEMHHGIDDMVVIQLLNTYDCHLNVTQSESWGMTITEAMATETPVIVANNSAQTEQMGVPHDHRVVGSFDTAPHGLIVNRGSTLWTQGSSAKRYVPAVADIHAAMRYAYDHRREMAEKGRAAREYVVENFQWDDLWADRWKPLLAEVEAELSDDYGKHYMDRRETEAEGPAFQNELSKISLELRGDSVVDVGCGPGVAAEYYSERGWDVLALDISEAAVERTQDRGVEARKGDVTDLALKSNSYDNAVSQHTIEHVEPDATALAELARVARKKAVAVVPRGGPGRDPAPTEVRRYTQDEIDRLSSEFAALTGLEMDAELVTVGNQTRNWFITVDNPEDYV